MTTATQKAMQAENAVCAQNYKPIPVVLTRAAGCTVWDVEGKSYLDFMSAYSAVSFGHGNRRLLHAMGEQAATLAVVSRAFYSDKLAAFLQKLCDVTGLARALPMNTGAEAVETAIKAARKWGYEAKGIAPEQAKIVVANGNFHGRTTTIVGFSSNNLYKHNFGPYDGGFYEVPFGDAAALEALLQREGKHIAAFLVEPMQGEAGIIIPPKGWLKQVQALCRQHNVLLILDEVQTGMGRTGKNFCFQHEIDQPDGLILGKALGGGLLPVSAFVARKEVMDVFTNGTHGSTFGGNPLACAVGMEALNILIEEQLAQRSATMGTLLMEGIQALDSPLITDVRGSGLWVGVEIDPAKATAREVCERLMAKGVLSKETHDTVVRFAPPLTISTAELERGILALQEVLGDMAPQK